MHLAFSATSAFGYLVLDDESVGDESRVPEIHVRPGSWFTSRQTYIHLRAGTHPKPNLLFLSPILSSFSSSSLNFTMTLSFAGHTVVITGAGGGLGRAYSVFFGSRGANVVVNDVSKENAQKVVDQIVKGTCGVLL